MENKINKTVDTTTRVPQQQQQYAQTQPQFQQVAPVYDRPVTYLGNKEPNFVNEVARKEFEKSVALQSLSQRAAQATKASDAQEKSAPVQTKGAVELG